MGRETEQDLNLRPSLCSTLFSAGASSCGDPGTPRWILFQLLLPKAPPISLPQEANSISLSTHYRIALIPPSPLPPLLLPLCKSRKNDLGNRGHLGGKQVFRIPLCCKWWRFKFVRRKCVDRPGFWKPMIPQIISGVPEKFRTIHSVSVSSFIESRLLTISSSQWQKQSNWKVSEN